MTYPVVYEVERPARFSRVQLVVRMVAFCALGVLGLSLGTVFAFAYLALPVLAAARLGGERTAEVYLRDDGRRVVRALRWFAAVAGWAGLVTERLPGDAPDEVVTLEVEPEGHPTPASAVWRVVTGLPSAIVLGLLGALGVLVWLWAALSVLIGERVGDGAFRYLTGLQRWSVRLLVYQASLVDIYPPFSLGDPTPHLPTARATT